MVEDDAPLETPPRPVICVLNTNTIAALMADSTELYGLVDFAVTSPGAALARR